MSHTPGQPSSSRAPQSRVLGPAVITLGFILFLTSILMRRNPVPSFGARELNAMRYANGLIGDSAWTSTGVLLTFAIVGFAITVATLIAYIAIYGVQGMQVALWIYPLAFVVVLAGAVGLASKRHWAPRIIDQPAVRGCGAVAQLAEAHGLGPCQ